jgi:hypothetical protein
VERSPIVSPPFSLASPCVPWTGAVGSRGYGATRDPVRGISSTTAHRVVYEREVGPIPPGLTIDHLCRNRLCVNVDHMEVVTNRVNILRGNGVGVRNMRKTHCIRGHLFSGENLVVLRTTGERRCRICTNRRNRESWARRGKLDG